MEKKLLILGAGGHGQVVAEVAEACGYTEIAFLDDNSDQAIGKISDIDQFAGSFADAFVGIGNNKFRSELIEKLKKYGFGVPVLIHPTAYVSKTARIEEGTVVEPNDIVNTHSVIGAGSIISIGSIVDHDVIVGRCCHVNSGAIIKAGAKIDNFQKLEAGEVVLGYETAVVKK